MLQSPFQIKGETLQKHLQFEKCHKSRNEPNPDLQANEITRKRCTGDLHDGD